MTCRTEYAKARKKEHAVHKPMFCAVLRQHPKTRQQQGASGGRRAEPPVSKQKRFVVAARRGQELPRGGGKDSDRVTALVEEDDTLLPCIDVTFESLHQGR